MRTYAALLFLLCAPVTVVWADTWPWSDTDRPGPAGLALPYEVIDGWAVHAGDIVLGTTEEMETRSVNGPGTVGLHRRNLAANHTTWLWPHGRIPYVIDPDFAPATRELILAAIEEWNQRTVISLFPRTSERDYVRFRTTTERCRSQVGRVGGEQSIWWVSAGGDCGGWSFLVHEIGHTVGLWHEHQRTDRDRHLTIREQGIDADGVPWLMASDHPVAGPYDLASVMHYHPFAHSIDGLPVIETIPPGMLIRDPEGGLSVGDVYGVATLYGSSPWWTTITTNPPGLEIEVNGRLYETPAVFFWLQSGPRTVAAPPIQISEDTRYVFGRWSDGGDRQHEIMTGGKGAWYQASYIVQHAVTASPHPAEGGSVAIDPPSPDGYYTLRTELSIHPQPDTADGFKFWKWGRWRSHGLSASPARTLVSFPDQFGAHFTRDPLVRIESSVGPFLVNVDEETKLAPVALHPNEHAEPAIVSVPAIQTRPASIYGPSRFRFHGWDDGGPRDRRVSVGEREDELVAVFQVERYAGSTTSESTTSQPSGVGSADDQASPAVDGYGPAYTDFPAGVLPSLDWEVVEQVAETTGGGPMASSREDPDMGPGTGHPRTRSGNPDPPRKTAPAARSYTFEQVIPRALTFVAPSTADAPPQRVTVMNPGQRILRFRFANSVPWLRTEPQEGVLRPNARTEIDIQTYSAGVAPDTYHHELVVHFMDENGEPIAERAVQVAFAVIPSSDGPLR